MRQQKTFVNYNIMKEDLKQNRNFISERIQSLKEFSKSLYTSYHKFMDRYNNIEYLCEKHKQQNSIIEDLKQTVDSCTQTTNNIKDYQTKYKRRPKLIIKENKNSKQTSNKKFLNFNQFFNQKVEISYDLNSVTTEEDSKIKKIKQNNNSFLSIRSFNNCKKIEPIFQNYQTINDLKQKIIDDEKKLQNISPFDDLKKNQDSNQESIQNKQEDEKLLQINDFQPKVNDDEAQEITYEELQNKNDNEQKEENQKVQNLYTQENQEIQVNQEIQENQENQEIQKDKEIQKDQDQENKLQEMPIQQKISFCEEIIEDNNNFNYQSPSVQKKQPSGSDSASKLNPFLQSGPIKEQPQLSDILSNSKLQFINQENNSITQPQINVGLFDNSNTGLFNNCNFNMNQDQLLQRQYPVNQQQISIFGNNDNPYEQNIYQSRPSHNVQHNSFTRDKKKKRVNG